uniref:Neurotensin/neuromedin N n=1 Tax=Takifugu rubripes TaxID=31033 RepID=A0A3B5KE41_TAKRU
MGRVTPPKMTHIRIIIKTTVLNVSINAGLAPNRGFLLEQVRQSAPYWPTRLVVLCRILSNLRQDASSDEEVMEEVEEVMEEVHNMQNLQQLCGALRGRGERVRAPPGVLTFICQLLQESLESLEENADSPLKRKSPYILRRQTGRSGKSRRPYILKRSAIY